MNVKHRAMHWSDTVGFTALPRAESVTIGPRRNTQAITTVPGRDTTLEVASCAGDSATRGLGMNPGTTPPLGRDLSETAVIPGGQVDPARDRDDRLKGSTRDLSLVRYSMKVASALSRAGLGGRVETSFLAAGLETIFHLFGQEQCTDLPSDKEISWQGAYQEWSGVTKPGRLLPTRLHSPFYRNYP